MKEKHFSRDSDRNRASETTCSDDIVKPAIHVLAEDRAGGLTALNRTPGREVCTGEEQCSRCDCVSASGLFLHLHWGRIIQMVGQVSLNFYHMLEFPRVVNRNI